MWLGERIYSASLWVYDQRTMDCCKVKVAVCVPPQRAFFLCQLNLLCEVCSRLDGALCYVVWPIWPWVPWLEHAVPQYLEMHWLVLIHFFFYVIESYLLFYRGWVKAESEIWDWETEKIKVMWFYFIRVLIIGQWLNPSNQTSVFAYTSILLNIYERSSVDILNLQSFMQKMLSSLGLILKLLFT